MHRSMIGKLSNKHIYLLNVTKSNLWFVLKSHSNFGKAALFSLQILFPLKYLDVNANNLKYTRENVKPCW